VSERFAKSTLYLDADVIGSMILGKPQTHAYDPSSLKLYPF
jgi:hypothetical protein